MLRGQITASTLLIAMNGEPLSLGSMDLPVSITSVVEIENFMRAMSHRMRDYYTRQGLPLHRWTVLLAGGETVG